MPKKLPLLILFTICFGTAATAFAEEEVLSGKPVGEIRLPALRYTRERLVRDALVSKTGEPCREENRWKDLEMLDRLGILSAIDIEASEEGGKIVLDLGLKETFPYLSSISADNTIGGAGIGSRLIVPYVNVIRFDLGGYGESGAGISLHIRGYEQADKKRERIR